MGCGYQYILFCSLINFIDCFHGGLHKIRSAISSKTQSVGGTCSL